MIGAGTASSSGLYGALTFHHARLEASLRHVISELHLAGTTAAKEAFGTFERELDAHLEAEETWLLPPFERVRPQAGESIRLQHVKVRAADARARLELGKGAADDRPLHELLELLDQHCRNEESDLYRWAETAIGEQDSRAVLQKIEAVELEEEEEGGSARTGP
jgi:hemerythrin superfamily protein